MSALITVVVTLVIVGFVLWLINAFIPMAGPIKSILNLVVIIAVIVWLLGVFGIVDLSHYIHVPMIKLK